MDGQENEQDPECAPPPGSPPADRFGPEFVPEEWELEGPAVSISLGDAADLDPALLAAITGPDGLGGNALCSAYGQDQAADALRPGPVLAALTTRLPRTLAGMAAGSIDYERAATAVFYTQSLGDADAARADKILAAAAPGLRQDQPGHHRAGRAGLIGRAGRFRPARRRSRARPPHPALPRRSPRPST
jgi:hypothetical protein